MLIVPMYHYIHAEEDSHIFKNLKGVSTKEFETQIKYLLKNFIPITSNDLKKHLTGEALLKSNSFYLTFDDGFKQHIDNALPLLKKYNLEGSFFIPTMPIKEKKIHFLEKQRLCQYSLTSIYNEFLYLFYEELKTLLDSKTLSKIEPSKNNILKYKDYLKEYSFYSTEERFYRFVRDEILSKEVKETTINNIFKKQFNEIELIEQYYMNEADIKKLHKENQIIGGHSNSHPFLERLTSQKLNHEIKYSIKVLEDIIGERIDTFSYPFGTYNQEVIQTLKKHNICYSFTTKDTINKSDFKTFEIKRIDATNFQKIKSYA